MSGTPLYVQRRELIDGLRRNKDATDLEWMDAAERFIEGDLADLRFSEYLRNMAWWLLLGDRLNGDVSLKDARKAGRYAGIIINDQRDRIGDYHHG